MTDKSPEKCVLNFLRTKKKAKNVPSSTEKSEVKHTNKNTTNTNNHRVQRYHDENKSQEESATCYSSLIPHFFSDHLSSQSQLGGLFFRVRILRPISLTLLAYNSHPPNFTLLGLYPWTVCFSPRRRLLPIWQF